MTQRRTTQAFRARTLAIGAASSFTVLVSCSDIQTGRDPEPPGPLLVKRLTLLDPVGRDGAAHFTDTSAPIDCTLSSLKNTAACVSAPFGDNYGLTIGYPEPDSAFHLRVVFNKTPFKLNGQDIETTPADGSLPVQISQLRLIDPAVVELRCDSCTAIPQSYNSLQVGGSDLSPDPTQFDYGPALQMEVLGVYDPKQYGNLAIPDDPLRALEPSTVYRVALNPGLSGRNLGDKLILDENAQALLTFATEPFRVLRVGIGDSANDTWLVRGNSLSLSNAPGNSLCLEGDGIGSSPYVAAANDAECHAVFPQNNGVLAVYLNAGVDHTVFRPGKTAIATVSINGAKPGTTVPVVLTNGVKGENGCERGNQRTLYIAPLAGEWAPGLAADAVAVATVTLRGADIRDVSQRVVDASATPPKHAPFEGRHVLSGDLTLQATIQKSNVAPTAVTAQDVLACAP